MPWAPPAFRPCAAVLRFSCAACWKLPGCWGRASMPCERRLVCVPNGLDSPLNPVLSHLNPVTHVCSCPCAGFCGETEEEHAASLDLLRSTRYDNAFLFSYSERGKTYASRHLPDDVPDDVKRRRLAEAFDAYRCGWVCGGERVWGGRVCVRVCGFRVHGMWQLVTAVGTAHGRRLKLLLEVKQQNSPVCLVAGVFLTGFWTLGGRGSCRPGSC